MAFAVIPIANFDDLSETYTVAGTVNRPTAFSTTRDRAGQRIMTAFESMVLIEQASFTGTQSTDITTNGGQELADQTALDAWFTADIPGDYLEVT